MTIAAYFSANNFKIFYFNVDDSETQAVVMNMD
jgi:hypothetical protein